jgi:hypothetical protein
VQRAGKGADAGIIHQDVGPARLALHHGCERLHRTQIGHVALGNFGLAARFKDGFSCGFEGGAAASANEGEGSHAGQAARDCGPDPPAGSGYDRRLPLQGIFGCIYHATPPPGLVLVPIWSARSRPRQHLNKIGDRPW